MARITRGLLGVCLFLAVAASNGRAQELPEPGTVGLSVALQQSQLDFLVPFWVSTDLVVAPTLGLLVVGDAYTDFSLGTVLKLYVLHSEASPYVAVRGAWFHLSPNPGKAVNDYLVGAALGGEYFFNRHFSVAVEAQCNATLSDRGSQRFGNPDGTTVNTASAAFAAFYF